MGGRSRYRRNPGPGVLGPRGRGVPVEVGTLEERNEESLCVAQVQAANGWAFMMTGRLCL